VTGPKSGAPRHLRRRHADTIGLDVGAWTTRLWTRVNNVTDLPTPLTAARPGSERSDASASVMAAGRDAIRSQLPRGLRRRTQGFAVVAAVPDRASVIGRRRLEAAIRSLNRSGPVLLMDAPLAAAAGTDLDISGTSPRVVLDVGVHGSEVAVLADGRVIDAVSCPIGCRAMERTVLSYLFRRHQVPAGPPELAKDSYRPISAVVGAVRTVTQRASMRTGKDVLEDGLVLVGGGAFLPPLRATLQAELATAVTSPVDPLRAVIRGLALLTAETDRHPWLWDT
jgi:actin-like ATPase involved in cell morphogenesis